MSSVFGKNIILSIFGESHGEIIGCTIHGIPHGVKIEDEFIKSRIAERKAGLFAGSTSRLESDEYEIVSGMYQGFTTGMPLTAIFRNENQQSKDYSHLKDTPRPGHADFVSSIKYDNFNDPRGGGHFSGRLTLPMVFAGSIAELILRKDGIRLLTNIKNIGGIKNNSILNLDFEDAEKKLWDVPNEYQEKLITHAGECGDSLGGEVEVGVYGIPVGFGSPIFDSVESRLAHAMFSIPAIKSVGFGIGNEFANKLGSQVVDAFYKEDGKIKTSTNNNGGLNGGITNGMPVFMNVIIKPASSINKTIRTYNFAKDSVSEIEIGGRHDSCILLRAKPVVRAMTAFTILDIMRD